MLTLTKADKRALRIVCRQRGFITVFQGTASRRIARSLDRLFRLGIIRPMERRPFPHVRYEISRSPYKPEKLLTTDNFLTLIYGVLEQLEEGEVGRVKADLRRWAEDIEYLSRGETLENH